MLRDALGCASLSFGRALSGLRVAPSHQVGWEMTGTYCAAGGNDAFNILCPAGFS